jgi:hypothetical protein
MAADMPLQPESPTQNHRLLVLSCSQRKLHTAGRIPAIRRYDGPAFQVLRRYLRENEDRLLSACVLSAEYGLISADEAIADYDRKMDAARATELRASCLGTLKKLIGDRTYSEVFLCMSRAYQHALEGIHQLHRNVTFAAPGQGRKLAHLKAWLYNTGRDDGRGSTIT